MQVNNYKLEIGATGTRILEKTTGRVSALFVNTHATQDIFLRFGAVGAVDEGIKLYSVGGSYEITLVNPWYGEIWAIASGAGTNLLVTETVQ